jgi:hypothetical protein
MKRVAIISGISLFALSSVLAGGMTVASASAQRSRPLPCHATMSNRHPADFTTTTVRVRSVAKAKVTTTAHYRTTDTTHHGRTNRHGRAGIPYDISGATAGFRVVVDVTVKWPHRSGRCRTAFTPHS